MNTKEIWECRDCGIFFKSEHLDDSSTPLCTPCWKKFIECSSDTETYGLNQDRLKNNPLSSITEYLPEDFEHTPKNAFELSSEVINHE